jgi:hypothetical protein
MAGGIVAPTTQYVMLVNVTAAATSATAANAASAVSGL